MLDETLDDWGTARLTLNRPRALNALDGALIAALLSDPSVSRLMEEEGRADRERTRRYFVKQVVRFYELPQAIAAASVDLLWAVTDAAGRALSQHELSIAEAEELCVQLITGGLDRLAKTSRRRPEGG